MLKYVEKYLES